MIRNNSEGITVRGICVFCYKKKENKNSFKAVTTVRKNLRKIGTSYVKIDHCNII